MYVQLYLNPMTPSDALAQSWMLKRIVMRWKRSSFKLQLQFEFAAETVWIKMKLNEIPRAPVELIPISSAALQLLISVHFLRVSSVRPVQLQLRVHRLHRWEDRCLHFENLLRLSLKRMLAPVEKRRPENFVVEQYCADVAFSRRAFCGPRRLWTEEKLAKKTVKCRLSNKILPSGDRRNKRRLWSCAVPKWVMVGEFFNLSRPLQRRAFIEFENITPI